jgi:hypothetical protein
MGQAEFNARWLTAQPGKDFDPPACDTGLVLLRRWAAHDPVLDRMLPAPKDIAIVNRYGIKDDEVASDYHNRNADY